MVTDYIWQNANPEQRGHLRTANEARAAANYAAWRALTARQGAKAKTFARLTALATASCWISESRVPRSASLPRRSRRSRWRRE
jgi:hypothetical protein